MSVFGPVPSRRLGRSLGIDTIPAKFCSYSCVYCQVGRTCNVQSVRHRFCRPEILAADVYQRVGELRASGQAVDYLTFVADGEPTLDLNLGREIEVLRPLGIKIAVITNCSLIWRPEVQAELALADWVSLKVDTVDQDVWHVLNQPHHSLRFEAILAGILTFAGNFKGDLVTETMLVRGSNDSDTDFEKLAGFLAEVKPSTAFVAVPIRPPAETWVRPPEPATLNRAMQVIGTKVNRVEYLTGYEGNAFASTGDVVADIMSITSVHPMREDAVGDLLSKTKSDWTVVQRLIEEGRLVETEYEGRKFYLRMRPCAIES